jgi:hypothetical protein
MPLKDAADCAGWPIRSGDGFSPALRPRVVRMIRFSAAVVAGLFVLVATPAVAQSPEANARVEGHWRTTIHPVQLVPAGDYSTHYGIDMSFRPRCAEGPCDVILKQPTAPRQARQTLKRDGARYSGTRTIVGDGYCSGRLVHRGVSYRATAVLRVVGVAKDGVSATHIRGRYTIRGTPRREACRGVYLLDRSTWNSKLVH